MRSKLEVEILQVMDNRRGPIERLQCSAEVLVCGMRDGG